MSEQNTMSYQTPIGTFSNPDARFKHIHLDIVGPLSSYQGYSYILTIADRFSHWPAVIAPKDTSTTSITNFVLKD